MQPYFLQDEQRKRYPPQPKIAKKLLNQNYSVWLMKRSVKMYWYDRAPLPIIQVQQAIKATQQARIFTQPDYRVRDVVIIPTQAMPIQTDVPANEIVLFPKTTTKAEASQKSDKRPKQSERFYRKPLPDESDEWLAQKVYLATGNLQEIEARQLVDKYGRQAVGRALGRMEFIREKNDLQNPAGFMKVVSRVCWLAINGFDTTRPEYQSPKKRKPRKSTYNPNQDPIWQSAAYCAWRLSFVDAPIDMWEILHLDNVIEF
jgi:hypothetical protein